MAPLKHLVRVDQLDSDMIIKLFKRVEDMRIVAQHHGSQRLAGYIVASIFYEASTRTRLSFEAAAHRLGARVIGTEDAKQFSSVTKGETLEDTIRIISGLCDLIVLRHNEVGAAEKAARVSRVPIINGGDGVGEHPTQALLDAYTIQNRLGTLSGLTVAMVGDLLNGRTVHSLVRLLAPFGTKFLFVSPETLKMPGEILAELARDGVEFEETTDFQRAICEADVLYMLRLQKERFDDPELYEREKGRYILNAQGMRSAKHRMIVMHPFPRNDEIAIEVDADPRAAYFDEADNGLFVRMALLDMILLPN